MAVIRLKEITGSGEDELYGLDEQGQAWVFIKPNNEHTGYWESLNMVTTKEVRPEWLEKVAKREERDAKERDKWEQLGNAQRARKLKEKEATRREEIRKSNLSWAGLVKENAAKWWKKETGRA